MADHHLATPAEPASVKEQAKQGAYTAVDAERGKFRIGFALSTEPGYHRCADDSDAGGLYDSYEEAMDEADALNWRQLGLSPIESRKIILTSMSLQNKSDSRRQKRASK